MRVMTMPHHVRFGRPPDHADLGQGGVLAIDANTVYTFNTGAEGCRFINFRASAPYVVLVNEDGGKTVPESERQWFKDHRVATPAA